MHREAESAAAACAHVAKVAEVARAESEGVATKAKLAARPLKVKLARYELNCTCKDKHEWIGMSNRNRARLPLYSCHLLAD